MLKSIIHDRGDDQSRAILENCRRALAEGGKLLIFERLMPERLELSPTHRDLVRSNLNMLVGPGGRERTEAEFRALLGSAGLRINRVISITSVLSLSRPSPREVGTQADADPRPRGASVQARSSSSLNRRSAVHGIYQLTT